MDLGETFMGTSIKSNCIWAAKIVPWRLKGRRGNSPDLILVREKIIIFTGFYPPRLSLFDTQDKPDRCQFFVSGIIEPVQENFGQWIIIWAMLRWTASLSETFEGF